MSGGSDKKPDPALEVELEIDPEWAAVRKMKSDAYEAAGIGAFLAFRLALDPRIDWHRVVDAAQSGASDEQLTDWYLD